MKVLIDMNLSPRRLDLLTGAGLEAVHWSSLGAGNAPDLEIMANARTNDYIVLTHISTLPRYSPLHRAKNQA
jgi:predicted nuclease of predicted toxin-antitoxin system